MIRLILYTRQGCHLCDRLDQMLTPYLVLLWEGNDVELIKRDIDDQDDWHEAYSQRVPVLEHEGKVILEGRPEAEVVAKAMRALRV